MRIQSNSQAPSPSGQTRAATEPEEAAPAQTAQPADGMDSGCDGSDPLGLNDPFYLAQKQLAESIAAQAKESTRLVEADLQKRIRAQHVHIA